MEGEFFMKKGKWCAVLAAAAVLLGGNMPASQAMTRAEIAQVHVQRDGSDFRYWEENSEPMTRLVEYVREAVDPSSKNFVPVEDRIAVFDMDGTLLSETTPYYFEWMVYLDRIYRDPSYQPTEEILKTAEIVQEAVDHRAVTPEIDAMETRDKAIVLAGLGDEEFRAVVQRTMDRPADGMENLKRGEALYLPMVEVLSYLRANDFTIYVVSGGCRQIVRAVAWDALPQIYPNHIIGADVSLKALHQGDTPVEKYRFQRNVDEIVTTGEILERTEGCQKAIKMAREIGKHPVLSFGNSMGDTSMHEYTLSNKKYRALAFSLCCDDVEREYGNLEKAEAMKKTCEERGWIPVSMRSDWKTIYGDDVKKVLAADKN